MVARTLDQVQGLVKKEVDYSRPLRLNNVSSHLFEHAQHGGFCCGVRHIFGFGSIQPDREGFDKAVEFLRGKTKWLAAGTDSKSPSGTSRLVEVLLKESQARTWHPYLIDIGYRQVARFRNPGSLNYCIMYVYTDGKFPEYTHNG